MQGEEPFLIWNCRRDHYPLTAIIPVPFWKKSHASIHSHPGCEQFMPPAEMQCLAVVPHLHFTSVFGAVSSNLSKSFWILTLSPCPCHPSPITLVCMHNKPAPSFLTVSSMQTKWSKHRRTCSPAVHTSGSHWMQQPCRDLPSHIVHAWVSVLSLHAQWFQEL